MKIITAYPVYINTKKVSCPDFYASLDGKSSKAEIQAFQDWMDVKHPGWVNGKSLNKGPGYGTFGPSTTKAWTNYGTEYTSGTTTTTTQTTTQTTTTEPTPEQKVEMAKKGKVWDKVKGWMPNPEQAKNFLAQVQQSGGIKGWLQGFFGGGQQQTGGEMPNVTPETPGAPGPKKKGMSKGLKIGLAIGGAVLLGAIIYFATRKKGK